ncbi:KilA-N domain-containing protein [Sneathiella marina]|uniref:KilA-N domain-containing protein n=1 Tax=Sneathiella marina TaxID=2950108 RepID=A0ABY4W6V3_9PROT|nr:KilA-N domain-containing protein [Sneathiella marina]USG61465.1 KilA-N domain-containing protein [Sneathiella marina]
MANENPPNFQIGLPLVQYEIEREVIHQRVKDGYVNATAMCKAAGRQFNDYARLKTTPLFIDELSSETGIPVSGLVQSIKGGVPTMQGTWVHPQVAIHLAQWLSPKFAVQVTQWIMDWMSGKIPGGNLPYHLRRYMANMGNVPNGHFSMLNEMTVALIAPLEHMGYVLPDSMVPDISEGRMFSKFLRDNGYDPDSMPQYSHIYEDGRVVTARAYPNNLLPMFRRHFAEEWMAKRALDYFGPRDQAALPFLENLLALPNYRDIAGFLE